MLYRRRKKSTELYSNLILFLVANFCELGLQLCSSWCIGTTVKTVTFGHGILPFPQNWIHTHGQKYTQHQGQIETKTCCCSCPLFVIRADFSCFWNSWFIQPDYCHYYRPTISTVISSSTSGRIFILKIRKGLYPDHHMSNATNVRTHIQTSANTNTTKSRTRYQ